MTSIGTYIEVPCNDGGSTVHGGVDVLFRRHPSLSRLAFFYPFTQLLTFLSKSETRSFPVFSLRPSCNLKTAELPYCNLHPTYTMDHMHPTSTMGMTASATHEAAAATSSPKGHSMGGHGCVISVSIADFGLDRTALTLR